ncbi:DDE-type integrase/transposase/recombinase [Aurantimonas sp. 22II-16-19i]|uniref:DDE-type integrase/transposase/recombinase n=1 Tax=Aurantimonas sp. 22II-16-19i TaxID=1317114 RepID=UPI0009F7FE2D|nr:DDE-type integrase/transposase/recombinase [Aurantimonas sp. 22II-16-19i]ORE93236.1 integrase catalytic subunit [Aurantimonas sp. 22II-16-19i]
MKEWLTAREIAAENLPQIGSTERAIQKLAEREFWNDHPAFARPRSGRGGGMEYHCRILPTLAQIEYKRRHLLIGLVDLPPAANDEASRSDAVTERAARRRDARLAIVKHFQSFRKGLTLGHYGAHDQFVRKYNNRSLAIEDWIVELVPKLTQRSLERWQAEAKKGGQRLAVDRAAARKGKGVLDTANDGAVKLFILGLIAHAPHLSAKEVRKQVRGQFGDSLEAVSKGVSKAIAVPPVRTFQHFLKVQKEAHRAELLMITNPDAFRSTMKMSGTSSLAYVTDPNQMWQIDASPVDQICTDGRQTVYACIDIATRRALFYISRTPTAEAVGLLIRRAILAWGVPEEIKCDNGSDFMAVATQRLLAALDITLTPSDPYAPEQKGFVERVIKTFQHSLVATLPGYVGHSVADRKVIENRKSFAKRRQEDDAAIFDVKLSGSELQTICDRWAETDYQHSPHSGLGGKTPFEVAATSHHTVRRLKDPRILDILLSPVAGKDGLRKVTKFGVRIEDEFYQAESGTILPGRQVFVRRDPNDVGRILLFDPADGRFLDEAICGAIAGIDMKTRLKAKKELQAEYLREQTAPIRKASKDIAKGPALHERSLEVAIRDMSNVTPLPKPEVTHTTPQIAAALAAAEHGTRKPKAEKPLEGRAAEIRDQIQRDLGAEAPSRPSATVVQLETRETRWRRALAIEAAMEAGSDISAEDARWLMGYRDDPEYRVMKKMSAEHGSALSF